MNVKPSILRDRLREATSQEILTAAEAVLARQGFEAAGMAAIAREAGVSVGTLYNYFKDKNELLRALYEVRSSAMYERLNAVSDAVDAEPFEVRLREIVHALFEFHQSNRNFLKVFFQKEVPTGSVATAFVQWLRPLTARGVADGVLAPRGERLYASALAGILRGVILELLEDETTSFTEATAFAVDLFLQGGRQQTGVQGAEPAGRHTGVQGAEPPGRRRPD